MQKMQQFHVYIKVTKVLIVSKCLNYSNSELQVKDTEFGIRNKLIHLLTELEGFKFAITLVLEFKKYTMMIKTGSFIQTQNQKQLLMKMILMIYLNWFIVLFYPTYNFL